MKAQFKYVLAAILLLGLFSCQDDSDPIKDDKEPTLRVGDNLYGGIIIDIDETGKKGLIVAPYDQSTGGVPWGCSNIFLNLSSAYGSGSTNTNKIIQQCNESNIAARICQDCDIDQARIYASSWFLPSLNELKLMYQKKNLVVSYANMPYWTSTDFTTDGAYVVSFLDGMVLEAGKGFNTPRIRCVRSFHFWQVK